MARKRRAKRRSDVRYQRAHIGDNSPDGQVIEKGWVGYDAPEWIVANHQLTKLLRAAKNRGIGQKVHLTVNRIPLDRVCPQCVQHIASDNQWARPPRKRAVCRECFARPEETDEYLAYQRLLRECGDPPVCPQCGRVRQTGFRSPGRWRVVTGQPIACYQCAAVSDAGKE